MLIVTDFGQRIQTPWYDIFPSRKVQQPSASAAAERVGQDNQIKHSDSAERDYHQLQQWPPRAHTGAAAYRESNRQRPRAPVVNAEQIMTPHAHTIALDADSDQAWEILRAGNFHHLPVVDTQSKLCGIISDRDLLPLQQTAPIERIMQRKVLCGERNTPIREVAEVMTLYRIGALPLIDADNRLEGIITRHDILKAVMNQAPVELWS